MYFTYSRGSFSFISRNKEPYSELLRLKYPRKEMSEVPKKIISIVLSLSLALTMSIGVSSAAGTAKTKEKYDVTIKFPSAEYPETAAHINKALDKGESAICTIDRSGADENRKESLSGIATKEGYDRDEWPMAMCAEGGTGADVALVKSSDNRGAGSWVENALEKYSDGTRVMFVVDSVAAAKKPTKSTKKKTTKSKKTKQSSGSVTYKNCTAAKEAGVAPLHKGDPGYSKKLDRDGDGVACER